MKSIGFKITVEFDCKDMIDYEQFQGEFGGDPMKAYKYISNDFEDSPLNFYTNDRIVKVELLNP